MKKWLQELLGIDLIIAHLHDMRNNRLSDLRELRELTNKTAIQNAALSRIIAKLDPNYGIAEDDPRRQAESDELGQDVIKKLMGEHIAQDKHRY